MAVQGRLELVTPEGIVEGWCWDERLPNERTFIKIVVDGDEAGRTEAAQFREDLRIAGIGDGCHSFRYILPHGALGRRRSHVVTLVAVSTGELIGTPWTIRAETTLTFDDRLSALEVRNELLASRLAELARASATPAGQAELFAVVGAFFERLSKDLARGIPPSPEQQLSESIRAINRTYTSLTFTIVTDPTISILVEAGHPLPRLYECLSALCVASWAAPTRVTALDMGAFDETALLPSLTRGLQYVRTATEIVPEWIEATQSETAPIIVFLSGGAVVDTVFFEQIVLYLHNHPTSAAVGGCLTDPVEGFVWGGMRLVGEELQDVAEAAQASGSRQAEAVHAVSHCAVAFRRTALEAVGGLDAIFGNDLEAATIDLCFRLHHAGHSVAFHPGATVTMARPGAVGAILRRSRAWELLERRWMSGPTAGRSPLELDL